MVTWIIFDEYVGENRIIVNNIFLKKLLLFLLWEPEPEMKSMA